MDDRKTKMLRDQREREQREARAAITAQRAELQESPALPAFVPPSRTDRMPGFGSVLGVGKDDPSYDDDSLDS
jgi:hypothetical protein